MAFIEPMHRNKPNITYLLAAGMKTCSWLAPHKWLSKMVNERRVWFPEKNSLWAKQQCGCTANRSTIDHLVPLETFIRGALIQNGHLVAVFFDFEKSFWYHWEVWYSPRFAWHGLARLLAHFYLHFFNVIKLWSSFRNSCVWKKNPPGGRCSAGCYLVSHVIECQNQLACTQRPTKLLWRKVF